MGYYQSSHSLKIKVLDAYHAPVHAVAEVYPDEISPYTYNYAVADDYSNSNFNAAEIAYDGTAAYPEAVPVAHAVAHPVAHHAVAHPVVHATHAVAHPVAHTVAHAAPLVHGGLVHHG